MKKKLLAVMALYTSFGAAAQRAPEATAQQKANAEIKINGQVKPLLEHIYQAQSRDKNHLRLIDFVRFDSKEGTFSVFAEGKPNVSDHDLKDVASGNYVFVSFYAKKKRGGVLYEDIGAIVFGTRNPETGKELFFCFYERAAAAVGVEKITVQAFSRYI